MNTLQSLVLPNLDVPAPEALSVRLRWGAWTRMDRHCVEFGRGGMLSGDTFYNGLSVGAWKRCCDIGSLVLTLRGQGRFVLSLGLHRTGQTSVWLDETEVVLSRRRPLHWPVKAWPRLRDGLLYWSLRALRPGRLEGAAFQTPDPPARTVRLGLVITHFNRQPQVLGAVARLERALKARDDLAAHVSLTVVDNSANLGLASRPGVRVIPSRNYGGTGGFMRGLLAAMDSGTHTHVLFMDDDASCETEAIARTWALLRHARDARQAVCGALLREAAPWHLLEKGARFDGEVRPLHAGLDVRRVEDLLRAEDNTQRPDYGAWWFFAFPIDQVKAFPFPFFVRGDDVHFGLRNRFQITTLNGVACLGEDFHVKHSPLTAYLDARYHLVLALEQGQRPAGRLAWIANKLFLKSLCSYQYSSARAVTLALQHTLAGPTFFREHLDLQAVRAQINGWQPDEKLRPVDRSALGRLRPARGRRESPWRRLLRLVTLQGFLLPGWLLKDRTTLQEKDFHGRAAAVFRYRRVLYEHAPSGTGFLAAYDRPRFFGELGHFVRAAVQVWRRLPALQAAYREGAAAFGQADFWRGVHGLPAGAAAGTVAAAPATVSATISANVPASLSVNLEAGPATAATVSPATGTAATPP